MSILDHEQVETGPVEPLRALALLKGLDRLTKVLTDHPSIVEGPGVVEPSVELTIQCRDPETARAILGLLARYRAPVDSHIVPGYVGGRVALSSHEDAAHRRAVVIDVWAIAPKCEACGR